MGRWFAALLLIGWAGAARADDLAGFHAAIEAAASHNRVALGYLRTENTDLAAIELDEMKDAWAAMAARYAGNRPAALRDSALFSVALVDVPTRIVTAVMMIESGRPAIAAQSLQAIRSELSAMRRAAGITVLADCVLDANAAMLALAGRPRGNDDDATAAADWAAGDYAAKAARYRDVLARCDRMATPEIRATPEFRRLIDGAIAGLDLIPQTVKDRDGGRFHRILIQLRAFDQLLSFRYG